MNRHKIVLNALFISTCLFSMVYFLDISVKDNAIIVKFKNGNSEQEVIEYVTDNLYVKPKNVTNEVLENASINAKLEKLDKYGAYFPTKSDYNDYVEGNNKGIGIVLNGNRVKEVFDNTPAYKNGIKAGDTILAVNGIPVEKEDKSRAVLLIKSLISKVPDSENIILTMVNSSGVERNISIKPTNYVVPTVTSKLVRGIPYIKINSFTNDTFSQFYKKLSELMRANKNDIIIDLRDNGGGNINAAIEIAMQFMKPNTPVCSVKYKQGTLNFKSSNFGDFVGQKVHILINEDTASASELLAGTLKDNGLATIYGIKSYGKSMIQGVYDFRKGYIKYTIGEYCLPKTGCGIEGVGLTPNVTTTEPLLAALRAINSKRKTNSL